MDDFIDLTHIVNENVDRLELIIRQGLHTDLEHMNVIEQMFPGLRLQIPANYVAPQEIQRFPVRQIRLLSRGNIERYTRNILNHLAEQMEFNYTIEVDLENNDDEEEEEEEVEEEEDDIIVVPEEAQTMERPGTIINLDRNHTIGIIPYHEIIESTHRQIFETESNKKVEKLEKLVNFKLYLTYCDKDERFTLCKDARDTEGGLRNSPWKTSCWFVAEIVEQFDESIFGESMKLSTCLAKQFKACGIEVFWKSNAEGHLQLNFYVDTSNIPISFLDANEKFSQLCQTQVAPKINEFLLNVIPTGSKQKNLNVWSKKKETQVEDPGNFQRFFGALEKWTREWQITDNYEIREDLLTCKLMDYQKTTVKWMLERELKSDRVDYFDLFENFEFKPPTNSTNQTPLFYFPAFGFFAQSNQVANDFTAKGGILADEMGLGKTIEMLALIMTNGKDKEVEICEGEDDESQSDEDGSQSPVFRKKIVSEADLTRNRFNWDEYHTAKKVDKSNGSAIVYTVTEENLKGARKRPRTSRDDETLYRKCERCQELCVIAKCGWKGEFEGQFWCPQCMATREPLEVKTTLIVLPESLVLQWFDEISRHCSEHLKVMFYFGLNKNGYLHPQEIAYYDVILTTYDTLRTELDFANFKNTNQSRLRNAQRSAHKFSPTSITHVSWWRLVADESQLVEGAARRAPKMCNLIQAHNRWCLTGTPIVRNVMDLHGLFRFINFWPFNVENFWREYVVKQYLQKELDNDLPDTWLLRLAGQIMRRNSKKMVEDEIRLPKLVEIEQVVKLSTIEERQYKEETEKVKGVVEKAIGRVPNEVMLSTMAGRERTLAALGKLRETLISCGEHVNFHKQKNMYEQVVFGPESVMLRLIRAKKTQIEEHLRMSLSSLCGLAGVYWIRQQYPEVAGVYERVVDVLAVIDDVNKHFKQVMKLELENVDQDNSDEEFFDIGEEWEEENDNRTVRNSMKHKRFIRQSRVRNELKDLKSIRKRQYVAKEKPGNSRKRAAQNTDPVQEIDEEEEQGPSPRKLVRSEESTSRSLIPDIEDCEDEDVDVDVEGDVDVEEPSTRSSSNPEEGTSRSPAEKDQPEGVEDDDEDEEDRPSTGCSSNDVDREKVIAQRKAEKSLNIMQRKAMRPLRIDCTMSSHLFLNMRQLQKNPAATEKMTALFEKMGGPDAMVDEYQFTMLRYAKTEQAGLQVAKAEFDMWMKEWDEHKDEHLGIMGFLSETAGIYRNQMADGSVSPYSLTEKVLASTKTAPFLTELSAWPVFVRSRQHLVDGQEKMVLSKDIRRSPHNQEKCMGLCNGATFEEISEQYTKNTNCQMLNRMEKFLEYLEYLRNHIFANYSRLLDFFANKSFKDLVKLQEVLTEDSFYAQSGEGVHNIIRCDHEKMDDGKVSMTAEAMKRQQANRCILCSVRYGLMYLRYEMGISSYHGYSKHGPSPLIPFYSLVCGFERRSNTSIAYKQHLGDFRTYIDRLRRTTQTLQSSLVIIEEYSNRIQEMTYAKFRLSVRSLRANKSRHNEGKNDDELLEYYRLHYESDHTNKDDKMKTACQELRYLAFLYDKERAGSADGDEDNCLICGTPMECLVVFPCGHRICETCYQRIRGKNDNLPAPHRSRVECVTCRGKYNARLIMVAHVSNRNSEQNVIPGVTLAVKLESSIRLMREIIAENSQNKIILFTTLEIGTHIWRFLTKVLQKAKMPFIEISRSEYGKRVFTFEFSDDCKILLCSLSMCANGLNLTQANHIIFLDPTHLSSVVAQAIGRISRYGQSREMKVYHMIVKSSIDEELRRIATSEGAEPGLLQQKERTGWTVGEIRQIFGIPF